MSEHEKQVAEKIAALPAPLKERFLTMAEGAVLALETLKETHDDRVDESRN